MNNNVNYLELLSRLETRIYIKFLTHGSATSHLDIYGSNNYG